MAQNDILKELQERIDKDLLEIAENASKYQEFVDTMTQFSEQSTRNTLLIHSQNSKATQLSSYDGWSLVGRQVKKGEKGIAIFAPTLSTTQQNIDGESKTIRRIKFKMAYVFDIAQTEGKEIAADNNPQKKHEELYDILKKISPYEFQISNGDNTYQPYKKDVVSVPLGMTDEEIIKSVVLQIAQLKVKEYNLDNSKLQKLFSHTTAYVVLNELNVPCFDLACTASMLSGISAGEVQKTLVQIQDTAAEIIAKLEKEIDALQLITPTQEKKSLGEKLDLAMSEVEKKEQKEGMNNAKDRNIF